MSYILIFGIQDHRTGREVSRRLRRTAKRLQRNVWELKSLSELETTAEIIRKNGGWAKAFIKRDEIILDKIQLEEFLKIFFKGDEHASTREDQKKV